MSLVSTLLTQIGYRLGGGTTISATSDPSQAAVIQWLNETALWITGICAEQNSDLGRTIGSITTIHADISAATAAANCAITATSHGLCATGETAEVLIKDVVGMTELNDHEFTFTWTSANAGTLGVASTAYTAYSSGGHVMKRIYGGLATTLYCPAQEGWIVEGHSRDKITLITESELVNYDPLEATEPANFYVDGSNNICFPSYPDDVYTVKIPYWRIPTALTTTTETVPFLGLMDNVFVEAVTIRAQNRDEYDVSGEYKWLSFLDERVKRVIAMRKKMNIGVSL
jgi:hypothetical protein